MILNDEGERRDEEGRGGREVEGAGRERGVGKQQQQRRHVV